MRGRVTLYVLLASALTFLVSLFMPWRETKASPLGGIGVQGLFNLFAGGKMDGWITGTGDVAVLLVIALVLAAVAVLRRPELAARLPLGSLGVALGYFAAAVAVEVHSASAIAGGFTGHPQVHMSWTYGFYVGLASGALAGVCGLVWHRSALLRPRKASEAIAGIFAIALLISFLLPWIRFHEPYSYPGIESSPAAIAALGLLLGGPWLHRETGRPWRLPLAIATAILTGAALSALWPYGVHSYGAWIGIGCAVSLVALEATRAWPLRLPALPHGLTALRVGGAALLIVALFLPWEEVHGGPAINGWTSLFGATVGGLCLLLVAAPAFPALETHVLESVAAIVLLVSALVANVRENRIVLHVGYGAYVGIAAAVILLVTALVPLRASRVEAGLALPQTLPLAASVLCVVVIVLPWWFVLPRLSLFQDSPLYGWLGVPGMLLALYLVRLWRLRMRGTAQTGLQLVLVPLVLLALAALELIRFRGSVIWSSVILVGLCLLLIVFGWLERNGRLDNLRIPEEIWRVDRLPEPES